MKRWKINYTVKLIDQGEAELSTTIQATDFAAAYKKSLEEIRKRILSENPEVDDVNIWGICIDDNVSPEEESDHEKDAAETG